ncbi:MAG: HDOD domain-containing protein [Thiotrichales bacterium]
MQHEQETEFLADALRNRIDAHDFRVPVIPEVVWKVMRIVNDPESNATELVNVVQSEPALAACVVRVANSAAYYRGSMVDGLPLAIARLGMTLVRDIAFATAVHAKMFDTAGFDRQLRQISLHALASALWAKELAPLTQRDPEAVFLCGLLHSIGKPILVQALLEIETFDRDAVDVDALLEEIEHLHVAAATIALKRWNMPAVIIDAISHQNGAESATLAKTEARVIQAARALGGYTLRGDPTRQEIELLSVFPRLGLTSEQVDTLLASQTKVLLTLEAIRG